MIHKMCFFVLFLNDAKWLNNMLTADCIYDDAVMQFVDSEN
jgi:hypothetical protein